MYDVTGPEFLGFALVFSSVTLNQSFVKLLGLRNDNTVVVGGDFTTTMSAASSSAFSTGKMPHAVVQFPSKSFDVQTRLFDKFVKERIDSLSKRQSCLVIDSRVMIKISIVVRVKDIFQGCC